MTKTLARRGPAIRLRSLSLAAVGTAAVVAGVAVVPDLVRKDDTLPTDVGDAVPRGFTVTYRVEAGTAVTTEVLTVQRPFASHLTVHEGGSADGRVLSERASVLGLLGTSSGGPWGRIVVPPAIGSADLRPDASLVAAVEAGLVGDLGRSSVGGRACRRYETATSVSSGTLEERGEGERAEICVDATGILLEERWELDGEVVRTRRATALSIEEPAHDLEVPDGDELDGSGELRALADDAPSPFPSRVVIGVVPTGFRHVGRYAVVPPDVTPASSNDDVPSPPDVAIITDVWVRGADLLLLENGATTGRDPFTATTIASPLALEPAGLGDATLVIDLRSSEIRIRLDDGAFVRLAGTLAPDELVAIASSMHLEKGGTSG